MKINEKVLTAAIESYTGKKIVEKQVHWASDNSVAIRATFAHLDIPVFFFVASDASDTCKSVDELARQLEEFHTEVWPPKEHKLPHYW